MNQSQGFKSDGILNYYTSEIIYNFQIVFAKYPLHFLLIRCKFPSMLILIILEIVNIIIFKKEGEHKQDTFTPKITGILGAVYRAVLTFGCLPFKAYISLKSPND